MSLVLYIDSSFWYEHLRKYVERDEDAWAKINDIISSNPLVSEKHRISSDEYLRRLHAPGFVSSVGLLVDAFPAADPAWDGLRVVLDRAEADLARGRTSKKDWAAAHRQDTAAVRTVKVGGVSRPITAGDDGLAALWRRCVVVIHPEAAHCVGLRDASKTWSTYVPKHIKKHTARTRRI